MTISPMQQEHVTKQEFADFAERVDTNFTRIDENFIRVHQQFARVDEQFAKQKEYTDDGFEKCFAMIETVENKLDVFRIETNKRFDSVDSQLVSIHKVLTKIAAKVLG